jgi:hypothetical protein
MAVPLRHNRDFTLLPVLLFYLPAGVVVDRHDRRRLMAGLRSAVVWRRIAANCSSREGSQLGAGPERSPRAAGGAECRLAVPQAQQLDTRARNERQRATQRAPGDPSPAPGHSFLDEHFAANRREHRPTPK